MRYLLILFSLGLVLISCKKEDTDAPVLQLIGADTVIQNLPSSAGLGYYLDPGVTAIDNEDGNITGNVLVENLVNPNRKGSYLVKYTVQDEAGNETSIQRVVFITNSAEHFAGTYANCADTCTTSNISYSLFVQSSDTVNRLVWINNFGNSAGVRVRAVLTDTNISVPLNQYIDLAMTKYINNVFTPPTDVLNANVPTSLRIKYSWTDGILTDTCTTWLVR